jgi:hypothetical protein
LDNLSKKPVFYGQLVKAITGWQFAANVQQIAQYTCDRINTHFSDVNILIRKSRQALIEKYSTYQHFYHSTEIG